MQTKITKDKKMSNEDLKEYIKLCLELDYRLDRDKKEIINDLEFIESYYNQKIEGMEIVESYDGYKSVLVKLIINYDNGDVNCYEFE